MLVYNLKPNPTTTVNRYFLLFCNYRFLFQLFDYERLVNILLYSVYGMVQESFVQRIGIYLLNSLACQVDGHQKVKLGELGAINVRTFSIFYFVKTYFHIIFLENDLVD